MTPRLLDTWVFNLLVATYARRSSPLIRPWWQQLYNLFLARRNVVRTTIHGRSVLANFGYTYPLITRHIFTFNNPLLELVNLTYKAKGRPVRLVDVGAAIGDTVLLVDSNCHGMVSDYVCVDGDAEFFSYLEANLSFLPNVRCILHQLSRSRGIGSSLVRTNAGTASAQGKKEVDTAPLDEVLRQREIQDIDILKVDVDGFDGEVLAGAEEILQRDRPGVIFEWHPLLCQQTGNDWRTGLETLGRNGYKYSAWFTKFGAFSHFVSLNETTTFGMMAEFARTSSTREDWHYDIVTLHGDQIELFEPLADTKFADRRTSRW